MTSGTAQVAGYDVTSNIRDVSKTVFTIKLAVLQYQ